MNKLSLIYAPLEVGAAYGGTQQGPQSIKDSGLEKLLAQSFTLATNKTIECQPRGNLTPEPADRPYEQEIVRVCNEIAADVEQAHKNNSTAVVVGGDHSVNLGCIAGASAATNGDIGLIYIDAHGDINTPQSSTSHNVHGMHLAALLGHGSDAMVNAYRSGAKLDFANLLHVAGKDFDQFEIDFIAENNIANYGMEDIVLRGFTPLLTLISDLAKRTSNIWVSFDLDSVDQQFAPGVGIQNSGGLTKREALAICRFIAKTCNVIGIDIVECNPPKDVDNKTAALGVDIALALLGGSDQNYSQYMSEFK